MLTLAAVYLEPGGLVAWLIVGLIAGFLAGKVMKDGKFIDARLLALLKEEN